MQAASFSGDSQRIVTFSANTAQLWAAERFDDADAFFNANTLDELRRLQAG